MNPASLRNRRFHTIRQPGKRSGLRHADPGCHILYTRLRSHPDNIIHIHIIPEYIFIPRIDIDHSCKTGLIQTEKIEKRTILTELISIIRIISRGLPISQDQHQTTFHFFFQTGASVFVNTCLKHIFQFLVSTV